MGWFWFVPTFHIPDQKRGDKVHLKFRRSEIDFPLGPGYWISEVDVELEWIVDEGHNLSPIPSEKVEKTEP
jgi:phosphatidylinositol-3,4,5-trisphosphate 3-phosphatase/dual-specificity protein phosphatase PTEN